jgi:hypothetical protein
MLPARLPHRSCFSAVAYPTGHPAELTGELHHQLFVELAYEVRCLTWPAHSTSALDPLNRPRPDRAGVAEDVVLVLNEVNALIE